MHDTDNAGLVCHCCCYSWMRRFGSGLLSMPSYSILQWKWNQVIFLSCVSDTPFRVVLVRTYHQNGSELPIFGVILASTYHQNRAQLPLFRVVLVRTWHQNRSYYRYSGLSLLVHSTKTCLNYRYSGLSLFVLTTKTGLNYRYSGLSLLVPNTKTGLKYQHLGLSKFAYHQNRSELPAFGVVFVRIYHQNRACFPPVACYLCASYYQSTVFCLASFFDVFTAYNGLSFRVSWSQLGVAFLWFLPPSSSCRFVYTSSIHGSYPMHLTESVFSSKFTINSSEKSNMWLNIIIAK